MIPPVSPGPPALAVSVLPLDMRVPVVAQDPFMPPQVNPQRHPGMHPSHPSMEVLVLPNEPSDLPLMADPGARDAAAAPRTAVPTPVIVVNADPGTVPGVDPG